MSTPPRMLLALTCMQCASFSMHVAVSLLTPPMKLWLFTMTLTFLGNNSSTPPINVWMSISSSSEIMVSRRSRRMPPKNASSRAPRNSSPLKIYSSAPKLAEQRMRFPSSPKWDWALKPLTAIMLVSADDEFYAYI